MSSKKTWLGITGFIAPLFLAAAFSACSEDDNSKPEDPPVIGTGGKKGDAGATGGKTSGSGGNTSIDTDASSGGEEPGSGGETSGSGGKAGTGGKKGDGGGANTGGSDNQPDSSTPACTPGEKGTDGCFKCPQTNVEFLNQCTGSNCAKFDNTRLPQFHGYPLPPLGS